MKKIILAVSSAIQRYQPVRSNSDQFLRVYENPLQTVLVGVKIDSK